jgi:hypothetical protein
MMIDEKITVGIVDNSPKYVLWNGRSHNITQVGLHHLYREGRILYHIFSVVSGTLFLRLKLNTENLYWRLEEIQDGI